ncbi:MAG: hypothetical protein UX38_C0006G0042 [Microgenomates group bacterium GW2011_GWC1_46_16]|nr:MAG: hypothetical protein UX38_C0006G0042 [Microgenomates group bacterium GW2011_GWC1_46_16]KKU44926.1 MAG: hypothetical protein UX63_C0017G0004 [Microgenomates group bacterium GW2011_GWB1_46_7]KKU61289.1 MAG: hypothetical protein UX82_C0004G0003 [Microgenomates group bacterium GW2011_GWE1_47_12]KKU62578.1 MAG: hypothetical protein UX84_C0004G0002 [Microgenomates group bacterium GW2011_GWD1_47_13]HBD01903.1 hypothetical protein [Candidatus Collierbacteria bacterium]
MKRGLVIIGLGLLGIGGIWLVGKKQPAPAEPQEQIEQSVLGTTQEQLYFTVNVPARFTQPLTAPNVIYSLTGGSGIRVSEGQSPTLTNTGVLSLQGQTGALTLTAGSGMTLSGLTLTNSDTGSGQNIFKTIAVSGQTSLSTDTNADTLTLAGSGGITLTTDPDSDKITITSAAVDYTLSGFTDSGTSVYLTTTTDNLGVGTLTPTYKLDVAGTGHYTGALTLDSTLGVTGTTTLDGTLALNGNITLGNAVTDTVTFTGRIADGTNLLPDTDLGSDLGSAALRFDNLMVANIYSNDSLTFSGQTTFSYAPTASTFAQASVIINPTTAVANGQLLGLAINGYEKAVVDEDGDIILGYSGVASVPVTAYPLTIYGHNATNVAYIDESGNANLTGALLIGGTSALSGSTLGVNIVTSSLTTVGALNSGSITSGFGAIDTGADGITTTGTVTGGTITIDGGATNQITTTGSENLLLMAGGNVGIGTTTPANTLTVLGDTASSVATGVEGLKLTDTSDVTKLAIKWNSTGVNLDSPALSSVNKLSNGTFETDLTGWVGLTYGLEDEFSDTVSAGSVNNTLATDGVNTRTAVDTNSKISVGSGILNFSTGGVANDGVRYPSITTGAGKILVAKVIASDTNGVINVGWDTVAGGAITDRLVFAASGVLQIASNNIAATAVGTYTAGTYYVAGVMQTNGFYWYIKGGSYTNWTLLWTTPWWSGSYVVLNSPINNQASWNNTFSWTGVTGATYYRFEAYKNDGTAVHVLWYTVAQACSGLVCSISPTQTLNLTPGEEYKWRIADYGDYGKGLVQGTYTNYMPFRFSVPGETPSISAGSTTSVFTADEIKVISDLWLPTPLAYDTFTRADGTIGSSETTGPDSQTTPSLAWTGGAIASNKNVITPVLGDEVITNGTFESDASGWTPVKATLESVAGGQSGNALQITNTTTDYGTVSQQSSMSTGVWYKSSLYYKKGTINAYIEGGYTDGGRQYWGKAIENSTWTEKTAMFLSGGTSLYQKLWNYPTLGATNLFDEISVKPMTLSSLFSTVSTSDTDVVATVNVLSAADVHSISPAGIVTNLNDATTPTAGLVAYTDGTYVKLYKFTTATTWTNLISATTTYVHSAPLQVVTYHSDANTLKVRVYYNNALVGTEQTVTDASIISNTKHGLFSTYSGNSFDNFSLFARGTGGEYSSAPFEEITPTRNTSIMYSGEASVQLVAGGVDATYLQSVTLPDTSTYNLTAYAYTTGAAVTSADLELYYDTAVLSTTYTSVGDGWYKLSGTLTGVASAKNYGVKVKGGKTVYVDNLALFNTSGAGTILGITNSTTGLGGMSVESTTTLNSGLASLQALIVKGFSGQTEDLQEWQDSTGAVLGSLTPSGGLSLTGNLDINGTSNDIAGSLNLSGNSLTSTGALTITPASGSGLNLSLATTGDFKVNTNDLVVDTSEGRVGIGTTTPSAKLHVIALTEQERLGYDTSNYWTSTVGITGALTMQGVGTGGALTLSPTAGQNLNVTLATTGDFIVNTNDLVADTSSGYIGINTTAPTSLLDIGATSGVDGLRLTNSGTKVLGLSYGTNSTTWDATSTDPTNKLTNGTFDADLTSWSEEPSYTLNDEFTTDRAAGAVNGTSAEPTGGTRTVVDTNSKLSITGSQLSFATGGVGTGVPDPGLWYASQARTAGKTAIIKVNSASGIVRFGWTIASGSGIGTEGFNFNGSIYDTGIAVANSFSTGTDYLLADVLRGTGHYMFIKGGAYTNWTLLYTTKVTTTTPMYPFVGQAYGASVFTADNIRIPTATWLPTPLAYDTFTRADGAIGSSETTGPDEQTTPALEWTGGAISGNTNVITPTVGDSVVTNGDFASWSGDNPTGWTLVDTEDANNYVTEVSGKARLVSDNTKGTGINQNTATTGTWYQFNVDLTDSTLGTLNAYIGGVSGMAIGGITGVGTKLYTGRAASTLIQINRGATEDITIDNFLVKPLTLSSLFSTVSTSDSDVIADANVTLTAGTQAGLVLNLDSTSSPANFIIIYHDGTSVKVDEAVAGVYTNKQTTTVTYSAGATLRVIREGTKLRVYYNNALVGAELTMTANTNIKHGLFSTYSGNSFDNFSLFPRGTGGEYEEITPTTLTATRETTIKYNNSTASVKLVGGTTYGDYLQSANVGDTETYNLIAYAYTDGSVVTSADLSLYYDTTTLTTTYTPMGGTGWYKLTGSFTGVASSKNYGVRVKAGKTVYVDEVKVQVGVGSTQTMYVLDSNTGVTGLNVQGLINGTLNGVATYTKAGTISDSDFSGGATDGLLGIDTTNHRIYFREGGEWHYAARTAGFQIPKEEVAGLSIGDTLIPYVETFMSDGAVHGLYRKLDINQLLNTPEALQFEGNTSLVGRVSFGDKDMAGIATVKTYTDQVRVNFTTPYQVAPMVNISLVADQTEDNTLLSEGLEATITEVTPGGFTILLDRLALRDYVYNWVAIMAPQAITTKSTSELMTIMMSPIPVATGSSGFE